MGDCMSSERIGRNPGGNRSSGITDKELKLRSDQHENHEPVPMIRPILHGSLCDPASNPNLKGKIIRQGGQTFELKAPRHFKLWTEFEWIREPKFLIPNQIAKEPCEFMRTRSFQEKYVWFRENLEKKRIHWSSGKSEYLQVDRANLLMSSNTQFEDIDFHKEVKIQFRDQQGTQDAGGLLREWMNECCNEIFNPELGMMSLCDTSTTFYKFNFSENVKELFEVAAKILGIIIGKAIFERIPLKCFLNYTILRQISSRPIQLNDTFTYDSDFYRGWTFMVDNNTITSLEQNFCVYEFDEHGTQITIPLKKNGFHIIVDSSNRDEFVTLLIRHYCTRSVQKMIEKLRYGIYKVVPYDLLSVFEPHELDMVINGRKEIDLSDLKLNVKYTNCGPTDGLVTWFWDYMHGLSQTQIENVLHFVTGNSRVPILGFKYLESNRGEYKLFEVKQVAFNPVEPYPKSHTCFNRLELPLYPDKATFEKNIVYISVENNYFGLQ